MYDVVIIGGGVIGCAVAYQLTKYELKVALFEKENDVADGTTKANSAIIHAGYDPLPGSLAAKLNVRGNLLAGEICEKLDVSFRRVGSLVAAFGEADDRTVRSLYERGIENGVPGLRVVTGDEARIIEPNLSGEVTSALYAPTAGVISPWEYALAMAETAVRNGLELHLSEPVTDIRDGVVVTPKGEYGAKYIVAAAGVCCDTVEKMVAEPDYVLRPSRGEYYLLDRTASDMVRGIIFQCPNENGKGVLVAQTVHGNVIVGPNAESAEDKFRVNTTAQGLAFVGEAAKKSVPKLDLRANIRNFAGMRANTDRDDFIIRFAAKGFLSLAGIKSPGLASAPAVAEYAAELLERDGLVLHKKSSFVDTRRRVRFASLTDSEKAELIKKNPAYGRVICRCETVTEGEILDTFDTPIPPVSIDGVKRRCNAGMGRCQGGFCAPRVLELIHAATGIPREEILKDKEGSVVLSGGRI